MGSSVPDPAVYFDDWFFTNSQSTPSCPGFGLAYCPSPDKACARDPNTGRRYCCDGPKNTESVCWTLATSCKSDGSTTACRSGDSSWCCITGTEKCTETKNQINICWSTRWDPLNNVTADDMAKAYGSLSAAQPVATSLHFDPVSVIRAAAATATGPATNKGYSLTLAAESARVSATSTADGLENYIAESSRGRLSGRAIAGAVAGVLVGAVLAVLAAFYLVKRNGRRQQKEHEYTTAATRPDGAAASSGVQNGMREQTAMTRPYQEAHSEVEKKDSREHAGEQVGSQGGTHELPPGNQLAELHGEPIPEVYELPTDSCFHTTTELPVSPSVNSPEYGRG